MVDPADPGLYIRRDVMNPQDIIKWAKEQGFKTTIQDLDMHVTCCYSKQWFPWEMDPSTVEPPRTGVRTVSEFKDGAIVLEFSAPVLQRRNERMRAAGAQADFVDYKPHITITYDKGAVNLASVAPYRGPIILGPEIPQAIVPNWKENIVEKTRIVKIDPDQRLVYGWISIVEKNGEAVIDTQGDVITEAELVKMAHRYVQDARVAKMMHDGQPVGTLVESMIFTKEVQKALGIDLGHVGWWGVYKINDDDAWAKVKSGEMTAFSIGGNGQRVDA